MASFHYNPFSNESPLSQWKGYLQQREYSNDLSTGQKFTKSNEIRAFA